MSAMTVSELRADAERALRALAGDSARLRDDQWRAVEALVVERRRVLVVQRTGWGKSAVYFVATALLRAQGAGPTVIVSPLLALMRNQIAAAERAGIRAATINSANTDEWAAVHADVAARRVDVLLVSPERLNNPGFRDAVLPRLAAETGLLVVDEAHCISDWGHDFRPDYRRIRTLLDDLPAGSPVLATTATANARVVADVAEQLGSAAQAEQALVLRGSLDRDSLRLGVLRLRSNAHRLAWLGEHLADLPGSGIVYTLTVAQADEVAAFLRERGHPVASYSGRTDPSDLGFVVHFGAPQSPIAYYQQVGRAGRGVERADVLLLPGREDEDIWRYYASVGFPPQEQVRRTLAVLSDAGRPLSTAALETHVELTRSRLETMLKVLDVDGAVRRVAGGWLATGEPWAYDNERYARVAAARAAEQQAMRDYIATDGCRMEFLRRELDDPQAAPCGRCDTCAGPFWPSSVTEASLAASRAEIARPGAEVEPRKMWPGGLGSLGVTGRIPAGEQALPGRVVGRLSDIGWGPRLRVLLADGAPDHLVPDDVFGAVVEVLRSWGWERRPTAVAAVPSRTRPRLVCSLAERVATVGRLGWLGAVERTRWPERPVPRTNSAQRVKTLHGAFGLTPSQKAEAAGAAVLLVDDLVDSGWTMALVARELRRAGAERVLPLALAAAG
jgi:ATP-dependent DNA helicase RecQ